ncbi:BamA/TamA family outer membrane protein [Leptolyngbya sp. FACHB-671]|uniref:BamA/TamA family outer membrane protein n=1 Tax=Leptolyngbya sp. FACHB-671 TaxID=2692812 RepID=UPI001682DC2E|nr:BamA/TamA family outer membrane protein [Leptolyngbya sp. FACHB-671]MBD2070583.1 BamA/TamA family outer membrane protein [Leptolyngbya sp. FACHB-671]
MRLSPVLLAVFTASAALGLSRPAQSQTSEVAPATGQSNGSEIIAQTNQSGLSTSVLSALPTVSAPEPSIANLWAQSPTSPPIADPPADAGSPPPNTQTPVQETPNQIQFDITPSSEGDDSPDDTPETPVVPSEDAQPEQDAPPTDVSPADDQPGDEEDAPPAGSQPAPAPGAETSPAEPRVLVAEVAVTGAEGELQDVVYQAIRTQPGRTTTRSQLQEDINSIFATGFFSDVRAVPQDTPLGVRVTFEVAPNPVLQEVQVQGNQVLPQTVVDEIFAEQYGSILNLREFQFGIEELNQWYQDNGYVLAQVIDAPQVSPDGTVTLLVAEGEIEDIQVLFLGEDGETEDENGEPIEGKTREFIITREFESQSGDVFNQTAIQSDLQRVFGLGIFEDVRVSLNPGDDPRKVDVVVNVIERNTGSLAAGVGFSSASGLFGTVSYQEQNLGGNNQRLGAEVQLGERDALLFDLNFTDPWIAGDPYRTSYTVNLFNRRSISLIFDGGENEVELENGDRPRVQRLGGGVSFSRPLDEWLGLENWRASAGLQYQRVSLRDGDGEITPRDELGNLLSFNDDGTDDLLIFQLGLAQDLRDNPLQPTSGSLLRLSTEQTVPLSGILFNRLRASYSYYIPVDYTNFTEGPETLALNLQAGTIFGDLPPYEAFSLGGTDSVRGYDSGELGSGRSFVQATAEYRFPIFAIVGGALFVDVGSDLGTGDNVPGEPAEIRDKPGFGFGYGVGVRVQSPLGAIRVDYGFNDEGDSRLHFGIGERF